MEFTTARKECSKCKKEFSNISRHQKKCKPELGNRYKGRGVTDRKLKTVQCSKCLLNFANIHRHKKLCKGPKSIIDCPLECGKKLLETNFLSHFNACNKFNFTCEVCGLLFKSINSMELHTKNHKIQSDDISVDDDDEFIVIKSEVYDDGDNG